MANTQGMYYYTKEEMDEKHKAIILTGTVQLAAYRRSVIALCEISTTDRAYLDSWSSGRLVFHRSNGLAGIGVININMENAYYNAYFTNVSYFSNIALLATNANLDSDFGFRPCRFKYNNKYYGGVEVCIAIAELGEVYFDGVGNFDIFGLDYYVMAHDSEARQISNSEVYNSLNYTQWTKAMGTWYT